jgi:hypothetical protein
MTAPVWAQHFAAINRVAAIIAVHEVKVFIMVRLVIQLPFSDYLRFPGNLAAPIIAGVSGTKKL